MVHMMPAEEMVTWKVEVTGRDGAPKEKSTHSTFKGILIAKEDLRRLRSDHAPTLSPRGETERAILDLCDGTRSVRQVAQEIHRRFPEEFRSSAEAGVAISRVIGSKTR